MFTAVPFSVKCGETYLFQKRGLFSSEMVCPWYVGEIKATLNRFIDNEITVADLVAGSYTFSYLNENATRETYYSDALKTEGISVRVDGRFIYCKTESAMQNDCVLARYPRQRH